MEADLFKVYQALPASGIWSLIYEADWASDEPSDAKAYILSCLSELAYLHTTPYDVEQHGQKTRLKVIPSRTLDLLLAAGVTFDVRRAMGPFDFPPTIRQTERFVYAIYRILDILVVAVRGTQAIADWGINLRAPLSTDNGQGRYHKGFLAEAKRSRPLIEDALSDWPAHDHVHFTGHSLGGAVASILTRIWPDQPKVRTPYTYGAPRFGDLVASRARAPFAFVKASDLVPHTPPRVLGYADAGDPLLSVTRDPVPRPGLSVLGAWATPRAAKPAAVEHSIERYRRHLGARVGQHFPELAYAKALGLAP